MNLFANHMNRVSISNDIGKFFGGWRTIKVCSARNIFQFTLSNTSFITLSVVDSKNEVEIICKPSELSLYKQINHLVPEVSFF